MWEPQIHGGVLDLGYVSFQVGPDDLVTQCCVAYQTAMENTKVKDPIGLKVSDHHTQPEGIRLNQ